MRILGAPLDLYANQLHVTWNVAQAGLMIFLLLNLTQDVVERIEKYIWAGPHPEKSFGRPSGIRDVLRQLFVSVIQQFGYRRNPAKVPHYDGLASIITARTCRSTEKIFNIFGANTRESPKVAILIHGIIILVGFTLAEIASLGAITTVGYAAYFTTGAEISLKHYYQVAVAGLLLITFASLFEAQEWFNQTPDERY